MTRADFGRIVSGVVMASILAACSFRPLYGSSPEGTAARQGLQSIEVAAIGNDRVGQQLRNSLISQFTPRGVPASPEYKLIVGTSDFLVDLLVQENSTVLRRNYTLTASYQLFDNASGKQVFSGNTTRTASLNRLDSEYANVIALRDAEERAAQAVADVMTQRLGIALSELASPEKKRQAALREAAKISAAPQPSATPPEPVDIPLSAPEEAAQTDSVRFPAPVAVEPTP